MISHEREKVGNFDSGQPLLAIPSFMAMTRREREERESPPFSLNYVVNNKKIE